VVCRSILGVVVATFVGCVRALRARRETKWETKNTPTLLANLLTKSLPRARHVYLSKDVGLFDGLDVRLTARGCVGDIRYAVHRAVRRSVARDSCFLHCSIADAFSHAVKLTFRLSLLSRPESTDFIVFNSKGKVQ